MSAAMRSWNESRQVTNLSSSVVSLSDEFYEQYSKKVQ